MSMQENDLCATFLDPAVKDENFIVNRKLALDCPQVFSASEAKFGRTQNDSGCGSVGSAAASKSRGPRCESSHR